MVDEFDSLVFQWNLNILLACWNNIIFFLSLKVWEFDDGFLDDGEGFLNILFTDDEGWCKTNDILVGWFGL